MTPIIAHSPIWNIDIMKRTPEPEIMDDLQEVDEYQDMNHLEVNQKFTDEFLVALTEHSGSNLEKPMTVLDVGTGPGQIPRLLCEMVPHWQIVATDYSQPMLDLAIEISQKQGRTHQIQFQQVDAKAMPFESQSFEAVISNSLIHHLDDPVPAFKEMKRVLKTDGVVFIRDLIRPNTDSDVESLVHKHAGSETPLQQQLLRQSLKASFTLEEIREIALQCQIENFELKQSSDRHWTFIALIS